MPPEIRPIIIAALIINILHLLVNNKCMLHNSNKKLKTDLFCGQFNYQLLLISRLV